MAPENADLAASLGALDRLLEHRSRLGICVLLKNRSPISFAEFKSYLGESDGNLGAHLRRLEDSGYVTVDKQFRKRKPLSLYRLSDKGAAALERHLGALDRLISGRRP